MSDYNIFDLISIVDAILAAFGYIFIFKKSGIKWFWAFIPLGQEYKLSQCADNEEDGRVFCISDFLYNFQAVISALVVLFLSPSRQISVANIIIQMIILVIVIIYRIRIYSSLCEMYGRKKVWLPLWIFTEGIAALIWGLSSKFKPAYKYSEKKEAASESDYIAEELDEGLSINIRERKVGNFFRKYTLLKDIHLNIHPGRMVLLLGGSGAGKTTFLNAIIGYEKADATICLNGDDVYKHFSRLKYDIGFVPQQDLIRYDDTVYNTLINSAQLRMPSNSSRKERKARVEEVMNIFGLTPVKSRIVGKQSGGQKKRISIATEFISDPYLFILDEPDSGLDGIMARELMTRLHEISREGKIVIVITHTPDRVIDLFDDVIVLAKDENRTGRLVFNGSIDEAKRFFEKDTMEEIVKTINRVEEGGDGKADELITKFAEERK